MIWTHLSVICLCIYISTAFFSGYKVLTKILVRSNFITWNFCQRIITSRGRKFEEDQLKNRYQCGHAKKEKKTSMQKVFVRSPESFSLITGKK